MKVVCLIPARMGSSRFPDKPLKPLLGLPMIAHVVRRCGLYSGFFSLAVATCDVAIRDALAREGVAVVMTAATHERATDRIVEALATLDLGLADDDLVLMVQGDEILVTPDMIAALVEAFRETRPSVVNLISPLSSPEDHDDPNTVKVVADLAGRALYMSRAPIPSRVRAKGSLPLFQQTGIIGFAAGFLPRYGQLAPTPLEVIESVDMMRVIEHGLPLRVVRTSVETIGVDTEADLLRAEDVLRRDPLVARYL